MVAWLHDEEINFSTGAIDVAGVCEHELTFTP